MDFVAVICAGLINLVRVDKGKIKMIITSRKEVFYRIEMTAMQAIDLQIFLKAMNDGHVNELTVQATHGAEIADAVHETLNALRDALEKL